MPTTNPVPSTDPSDLLFNAGKLDEVVNGTANSFTDRLGVVRRTVAGMNADFDAQLADAESDLNVYRADAAASAAEALGYLQTIRATSYGAYASDPATDPLGNPPTIGDEYFNTTANLLKRWNGTTWQASDINTANLAASSGSSLVGYDGGTVQDVLDGAKPMADYVALRAYTGRATSVRITSNGLSGFFYRDDADTASLDNGGTIIVSSNGKRWKRLFDGAANVKWFGAKGNGALDDTAAVQAAHAASRQVHYPHGHYKVTMANNAALVTFTSQSGIRITSDGAVIYDPRVYTGDPVAPVFDFVGCTDAVINLNYEGATLSSPSTQLGYLGGTFIRWRNGSDNIRVDAEITNARYGVLSGSYADTTQGGNRNIKANLRTRMCGYPVALYDVESVDIEIDADGIHRAAYLAGVQNGRVLAIWKDQYIAQMAVICTDALISGPALKGCKNLDIQSYDKGSTVFQNASACCGLSPSRSAYPVTHSNLRFIFGVTSTDTVSTKVSGFTIGGGSGPLPSGDPYNWEQTTVLENITVSGVIDRTGQTLDSNTAGDVYVNTNDSGTHYATVRNFSFENITIVPSSGTTRDCYFIAPGLEDVVSFRNFVSSGAVDFQLAYKSTARAVFENCALPGLVQAGTVGSIQLNNTYIASMPAALTANGNPINASTQNGAGMTLRYKETTLTLSGASTTWTNAIPLGAVVMGCVSRIMTNITGATGYLLGIGSDTSRWANANNLAAGLATSPNNYGAAALSPQIYQTSTSIVVTAKTSDFTGGTLKVCLYYFDTTGPTS